MRVSVIVATHDRKAALHRCLTALRAQEHPDFEILVVDDASSDATEDMVRSEFPEVRLCVLDRNRGPAAARNCGIEAAVGELLVFTDDDCVAPPGWLLRHERLHTDAKIGAVGGPQVSASPNFFDRFDMARYPAWHALPADAEPAPADELYSNNLSLRREVLERVGRFDERYLSGADPQLTRRIGRAGYGLLRDPGLRVEHTKVHTFRSYLVTRFHRGCGSLLADLDAGTLRPRRFVPLPNPAEMRRQWRVYRQLFGGGASELARFAALGTAARVAEVAGRAYYRWTQGRR